MSNAKVAEGAITLELLFLIALEPERLEDASPFRGFGQSILRMASAMIHLLSLPSDPRHLYLSRDDVIGERIGGFARSVLPLDTNALLELTLSDSQPLVCIVSDRATHAAVVAWQATEKRPVLHLCIGDMPEAVRMLDATRETFRDYFRKALTSLSSDSEKVADILSRLV